MPKPFCGLQLAGELFLLTSFFIDQTLELEHYLEVLYRKAGALAGSKPLEQRRQAGLWPVSFDRIWRALIERHGKQSGTRQMIDLLELAQKRTSFLRRI